MQFLKLLIVDDEEIIRKGLAGIVDWESLGYQVVATLEDGKSAIEYLDRMPVDVVLTDIKMTFVSGIDLAKFIYEQKPNIKIVLISGYKEFELARQAVRYNAFYYLLKPTNIDELVKVFGDLKLELDKERQKLELNCMIKEKYDEIQMFYIAQLFTDLLVGAIHGREELRDRAGLLNLGEDISRNRCMVLHIKILNYSDFISRTWNYGKEGLYNAVKNVVQVEENGIKYISLENAQDVIQIIAFETDTGTGAEFTGIIEERCGLLKKCLQELIGIEVEFQPVKAFENMLEMAECKGLPARDAANAQGEEGAAENNSYVIAPEQKKMFLSYVSAGNYDSARNMMESMLFGPDVMNVSSLRDTIINLFAMLMDRLQDFGVELQHDSKSLSFHSLYEVKTAGEIKKWAEALLKTLVNATSRNLEAPENKIVINARKYIMENYNRDITLEDVAASVFLSPVYFSRLFKQKTGENFIDFLLKLRMDKAREFLTFPEYKIYEICTMVGYKSTKYFYGLFKNHTGYTPTEYRNNILKTGGRDAK